MLPIFPIRPPLIGAVPPEVPQQYNSEYSSADVLDIRSRNRGEEEGSEEFSINTAVEEKIESGHVV